MLIENGLLVYLVGRRAQLNTCLAGRQGAVDYRLMTTYTVYVLKSINFDRYYTGMTADLERRLAEHNSGKTKSTKAYKPWKIVYKESFSSRSEARAHEKYLKSGSGREWIKKKMAS